MVKNGFSPPQGINNVDLFLSWVFKWMIVDTHRYKGTGVPGLKASLLKYVQCLFHIFYTKIYRASAKLITRLQDPVDIFSVIMKEVQGGTMCSVRDDFLGCITEEHICTSCNQILEKRIEFLHLPLYCPPRLIQSKIQLKTLHNTGALLIKSSRNTLTPYHVPLSAEGVRE